MRVANLTVARKSGRTSATEPEPFADAADAAAALGVDGVVTADLPALRELHRAVTELADGVIAGGKLERPVAALNRLAAGSRGRPQLEVDGELGLRLSLDWTDETLVAALARQIVLETGAIDATRLRRCQRAACDLVFYDTTRSNTRRWHAESPCGLRERQDRHRARLPS